MNRVQKTKDTREALLELSAHIAAEQINNVAFINELGKKLGIPPQERNRKAILDALDARVCEPAAPKAPTLEDVVDELMEDIVSQLENATGGTVKVFKTQAELDVFIKSRHDS